MNFLLEVVDSVDSTTAELLRRTSIEAPLGTALLALRQHGGRGRSERVWESPVGGMYLSVVLETNTPQGLSLLGAKALIELLKSNSLSPQLRWPNDVILAGKKVGGVLPVVRYSGNRLERAVLGVGFNVNQKLEEFSPELQPALTTLSRERPSRTWDVVEVAESYLLILKAELEALNQDGLARLARRCESDLEGIGDSRSAVLVEPGCDPVVLSRITGLDSEGALLFEDDSRLSALGREQRLRLSDDTSPT